MNKRSASGIYIALGSNLPFDNNSPAEILNAAILRLAKIGVISVEKSGLWQSPAWPDPSAPAYVNAVIRVETSLSPRELLAVLQQVETEFGRVRAERYASRTLDLDIVDYNGLILEGDGLTLPHPRLQDRAFVLLPLRDIAPEWTHPLTGNSVANLIATLDIDGIAETRKLEALQNTVPQPLAVGRREG